ncbi:glycosyltransferase family 4 protein [Caldicellulosiruptoraceae bacterium PP1]
MRILQLTWEYPPRIIGGISRVVENISQNLSKENTVYVITFSDDYERYEDHGKLKIIRVPKYSLNPLNFVDYIMLMNMALAEKAIYISNKEGKFDIIHVHDWLCSFAGRMIKNSLRIPLVSTIHATEYGRNNGIHNELQNFISNVEWWLCFESWKVIVNSNFMKWECERIFNLTQDKIEIIPNGINVEDFEDIEADISFRRRFALDSEKIIFYIGRHVYEKGVQLLIDAMPHILEGYSNSKLVIAGNGPMFHELYSMTYRYGINDKVLFTGFISDEERKKLFKVADVCVFPSLYEPFGIVALESMAAGCATVVSDVGGFNEIVRHAENGMKFYSGNKYSLSDNVVALLLNDQLRHKVALQGKKDAKEVYSWGKITERLQKLYSEILKESKKMEWFNS